jgi:O-antigen/teichoic acid export membrane protein
VMAVGMAVSFLGPILYHRAGDASDYGRRASVQALTWKITLACLGLTMLGFLLALCLHEWIFTLLVSREYRSVSYLMPWMVLAGGLFAAGQMLALKLISDMQVSVMTSAKIWTAVLGIASNFYAGSVAGVQGVVVAIAFVSGVYFVWMLWLLKKCRPLGHA